MSYLSTPRLVFAGQFQADVSTVNNDPHHFDTADFRSSYDVPGVGAQNGWWNPGGSGAWRFFGCTVTAVVYEDGTVCDDPFLDPVVGMPVSGTDRQAPGKLVDLDSEMQMVSEIWGFQVLLGSAGRRAEQGGGPGLVFRSDFDVAPFFDIWLRYPQGQPDSFFGAGYQSVLSSVEWQRFAESVKSSRFLAELTGGGAPPDELSIKFNVDGFDDDMTSPTFTFGRVVGSIGRHEQGHPKRIVLGRHLDPPNGSTLNNAAAVLDGRRLSLDLGNSLPTTGPGKPLVDQGHLYVVLDPGGEAEILGEVDYANDGWYEKTAGIVDLDLSPSDARRARSTPLGVAQHTLADTPPAVLLAESSDGLWLRADQFVFRLDSPGTSEVDFWATRFGRLTGGERTMSLAFDNSQAEGFVNQGVAVPGPPVGVPASGLTFPATATLVNGRATVELRGDVQGYPRTYIDGQIYGVTYGLGKTAPAPGTKGISDILSVLVWSRYETPKGGPSWLRDVQPILQQYADLYPVMRQIVDLGNYASVVGMRQALRNVFSLPVTAASYMPVTRDLSTAKREMLLAWLADRRPRYMHMDSAEDVKRALQQAVELEHATLPPYLTALYSIKPGRNVEVAELIRSIVLEEMLHMSLSSNLLISIGGSPSISAPGFVPRYPGGLPGGLRGNLTVRLRRCSIEQVRDVFLSIEEPEEVIEEEDREVEDGQPVEREAFTIGWFYTQIKHALKKLHAQGKISFGHADRQLETRIGPHRLFKITSLDDALRAIDEIMEQGEGATPLDPAEAPGSQELSHFYKFSEIVHGRRIVIEKDGFGYTGEVVPFDPDGIYPMVDDPDTQTLPQGSRARILSEQFNESYQALLNALHETFNGQPDRLKQAFGAMYTLEVQARQLMQTDSGRGDGTTAGPSFQLPFPL